MCCLFTLLLGAQQFGYYDMAHHSTVAHPNWGSDFGRCVAVLGDLDGDLVSDFAATATEGTGQDVHVHSGAMGALLFRLPASYSSGHVPGHRSIASSGDLTLDGVPDILVRDTARARLCSGADGALIWEQSPGGGSNATPSISLFRDFDGDLIPDVVTGGSRSLMILSGASGAVLHTIPSPFVRSDGFASDVDARGDCNFDGVADILAGHEEGGVALFNGLTGALIRTHGDNNSAVKGTVLSWIADLDGDLRDDYAIAEYGSWYGYGDSVLVYSGETGQVLLTLARTEIEIESLGQIGDQDADGRPELAIGGSGMQVYSLPEEEPKWILSSLMANSPAVSFSGSADFDLQPGPDLVIGFPGSTRYTSNAGYASAEIWTGFLNPVLGLSALSVSASAGGRVDLPLDFPLLEQYFYYRLLVSTAAGSSSVAGMTIPLTPSRLLAQTSQGLYPPFAYWPKGRLDFQAQANSYLDFLPGEALPWVGRTVWLAAASIRLDGNGRIAELGTVSLPSPLTFLP